MYKTLNYKTQVENKIIILAKLKNSILVHEGKYADGML
jgi:hypothetical protein